MGVDFIPYFVMEDEADKPRILKYAFDNIPEYYTDTMGEKIAEMRATGRTMGITPIFVQHWDDEDIEPEYAQARGNAWVCAMDGPKVYNYEPDPALWFEEMHELEAAALLRCIRHLMIVGPDKDLWLTHEGCLEDVDPVKIPITADLVQQLRDIAGGQAPDVQIPDQDDALDFEELR